MTFSENNSPILSHDEALAKLIEAVTMAVSVKTTAGEPFAPADFIIEYSEFVAELIDQGL